MKHLKSLLFAAVLFVGATSFTTAQTKIAHINKQELIKAMPAYAQAQTEIEKLGKTYEATIQTSLKELDVKLKQYNAEAETKTEEENMKRMQEVEGIKQSLGEYQQQAQKDLQEKEFNLLKPIVEKADNAIKAVAKAQGYQYVVDSAMLIVADGKNLMMDVKKQLGM
ncbi:periplasmic chaperone for outer membrane proteins Skp [Winogradskyella eximia]|jgi:outer membrane protein|uniref:Periplasmic chaperone for outer membrane proteins Skp n=1 Tax=Winogradskyella eximia TaxID=262006 RepID=A0A3D9H0T1_9FLAO|nr:OmpH family outer membrane protein [Winogradskyella eximia]RED43113.1 periplasmic chaperone for outer membrane proteins Skp [Winogradskyella eximia]|tara:strand:+ start:1276 stop:1776 length:501 start_codon:yes stop_codon:yes gene_type:complete